MAEEPVSMSPETVRNEIAETRGQLSETLGALETRLAPNRLKWDAVSTVKRRGRLLSRRLRQRLPRFPAPAALITGGANRAIAQCRTCCGNSAESTEGPEHGRRVLSMGQRLMEQARMRSEQHTHQFQQQGQAMSQRMSEQGRNISQSATEYGRQMGESASHDGDQIAEQGAEMMDTMQQESKQAAGKAGQTFSNYPLRIGLLVAATGFTLGMLLPVSRREKQWMGGAGETAIETARTYGQDLLQRGRDVAERSYEAGKEQAQEEASEFASGG